MNNFNNKTILFTGGTGSFGQKIVKYLNCNSEYRDYKEIRIFSRDELKQDIMRKELNNPKIKFYIGDVRDRNSVDNVMKGVNLIFHAAALKQVPSCEFFPTQAVLTNVTGSSNVIESAIDHNVDGIVCLSTDKAVCPINAMGMTKALMEKIAMAASMMLGEDSTIISCIRYGNVMCSRGSVIPLFIDQIKKKQPITITDSNMTRFMLSLQDAIDLVLFAFKNAKQGDLFIRKAPSCSVGNVVLALKNLFNSDVPIKEIGIRHGEKIFETLATAEELSRGENMGDYFRVKKDDRDLNYNKYFVEGDKTEPVVDYTSMNTKQLSVREVEILLASLPEVQSEL